MSTGTQQMGEGTPITVEVAFESDWRIGVGHGRGSHVDSATVKGSDGLPYLPAKSLVGVLRDSAETIAAGLDDSGPPSQKTWALWVEHLFGSRPGARRQSGGDPRQEPRPAALLARPLTIGDRGFAERVASTIGASMAEVADAATVIRPGVAIDPATGTALPDFLRMEERARAGFTYSAQWILTAGGSDAPDPWPAVFLLRAAANLTVAVGGKRRRGAGEASVSMRASGEHWSTGLADLARKAVDATEAGVVPAPPDHRRCTVVDGPGASRRSATSAAGEGGGALVHCFDVTVTALTPLLVGGTERGNTVTSGSFIPGTMLLPLVMRSVPGSGDLLRSGRLVVSDALPSAGDHRSVPWPLALARHKDSADAPLTNLLQPHEFDSKVKPLASSWLVETGAEGDVGSRWSAVKVAKRQSIHASLTSAEVADGPELFVYEAIEAGTSFVAEVWLPADVNVGADAFPAQARFGRSKKDDFGSVELRWRDVRGGGGSPAGESPQSGLEAGSEFRVLLESDVLLRNDAGVLSPTIDGLRAELSARLGARVHPIDRPSGRGDGSQDGPMRDEVILRINRRESWHVGWGLPRPSLPGFAAGSVFRFTVESAVAADRVAAVVAEGIGVRRAEGFGRIAVNPRCLGDPGSDVPGELVLAAAPGVESSVPLAGGGVEATLDGEGENERLLSLVIVEKRIMESAHGVCDELQRQGLWTELAKLTRSQLGVVRRLLAGLGTVRGIDAFQEWAEGVEASEKRRHRLQATVDIVRRSIADAGLAGSSGTAVQATTGTGTADDGERNLFRLYEGARSAIPLGGEFEAALAALPDRDARRLRTLMVQLPLLKVIDLARKGVPPTEQEDV